jgi:hypothetical protein
MLILVIDVSGSMSASDRIELAAAAAKAVVKTLAWKDQVGFVLFNGGIAAQRAPVYATDDNRAAINAWIDGNVAAGGGTAFYQPIAEAVTYIDADPQCSNVILMLTDGVASFSEENYASVTSLLATNNVVLFTYALGSGADSKVMKRLACENNGIFYQVEDNAALGEVMSSYYAYYAASISNTGVRWILYTDAITGTELLAACTPLYDTTDPTVEISVTIGVVCMDLNVIRSVADLRTDAGWDALYAQTEAGAETCVASWSGRSQEDIDNALEYIRSLESSNGAEMCFAADDDDGDDDSGLSTGGMIALIVVGVILFIFGIGWSYFVMQQKQEEQRNRNHVIATQQEKEQGGGEIMMGVVVSNSPSRGSRI